MQLNELRFSIRLKLNLRVIHIDWLIVYRFSYQTFIDSIIRILFNYIQHALAITVKFIHSKNIYAFKLWFNYSIFNIMFSCSIFTLWQLLRIQLISIIKKINIRLQLYFEKSVILFYIGYTLLIIYYSSIVHNFCSIMLIIFIIILFSNSYLLPDLSSRRY